MTKGMKGQRYERQEEHVSLGRPSLGLGHGSATA
jgi:hypothetical protein